jgi:hypothetical protein
MFENRTIPLAVPDPETPSLVQFTDHFDPYERHVYEIAKEASGGANLAGLIDPQRMQLVWLLASAQAPGPIGATVSNST